VTPPDTRRFDPQSTSPVRLLAEQAFSRAAGAPLIDGNCVRVLKDAAENYPAWLAAIASAQHTIFFENYIIAADAVGRRFIAALATRARAGVRVHLIRDWMGSISSSTRFWQPLIDAGGEVRCFNPPRLSSPFGWLQRDHRKMMTVDGRVGYVSGLCVSTRWEGDAARGVAPWRDTGLEITGPAVADVEQAFAQVWAASGAPLAASEFADASNIPPAGTVTLRVLASQPNIAGLYRLDQLIASMATQTLWLTDAYFVGIAPYVQALRAAALDGVDVRLLVPGASDLPAISTFSRAGYRVLLDAGIRVFEWNGPMLHAKTAVADGRWARVGSSNLNLASWIGNYELDIAIEDRDVAATMTEMYENDLQNATEIVLSAKNRVRPAAPVARPRGRMRGSASRAAAGALRIGNTVGAAMTNRRILGPAEAGIMAIMAAVIIALIVVALLWPLAVVVPLALLGSWVALSLVVRAFILARQGGERDNDNPSE